MNQAHDRGAVMNVVVSGSDAINTDEVIDLYQANGWSSAERPTELLAALRNSHSLVTASTSRSSPRTAGRSTSTSRWAFCAQARPSRCGCMPAMNTDNLASS